MMDVAVATTSTFKRVANQLHEALITSPLPTYQHSVFKVLYVMHYNKNNNNNYY